MDPVGKQLLAVAEKELGYREKSGGYTKYGEWYGKKFEDGDSYFTTAPWCDMFLAWAAHQVGVQEWAGEFAATIQHARWFEENDAWGTKPEPGAIVFFAWSGSKSIGSIQHVGIVEKVEGSTIHTIEANTDGVHLKRKERDPGTIVGYGYPGRVEVAGKAVPGTPEAKAQAKAEAEAAYTPRHAAPGTDAMAVAPNAGVPATRTGSGARPADGPAISPDLVVGSALALAVCGTVALGAGRSLAARMPAQSPVRVRRRGKHHRTPVALPADVTPADLDSADAGTLVMPAVTAAVAAEAEDREFWGRVSTLEDDQDLRFWDTLHTDLAGVVPSGSRQDA
ncbi:CHAP domain-containing protein [Actinomadura flavalba]|uniref:CHAP domain-containing protein n=1 Tax=Actinomadura flavalba TaxID=1120938 RepID=UPI000376CEEE|nr:CHAP domain-containing protein [Actinomadura flavalba]